MSTTRSRIQRFSPQLQAQLFMYFHGFRGWLEPLGEECRVAALHGYAAAQHVHLTMAEARGLYRAMRRRGELPTW